MAPITSSSELAALVAEMRHLLDIGRPREALALTADADGVPSLVLQFLALTFTEAGLALRSTEVLSEAVELWKTLDGAGADPALAYNRANAELNLFEVAVANGGWADALLERREHLAAARALYRSVGENAAEASLSVEAFTNLGNSYDRLGRDVDALDGFRAALSLDDSFGMARGNLGLALVAVAPFAGSHAPAVGSEGLAELELALADRERIEAIGGPAAFEHFERALTEARARGARPARPAVRDADFDDGYHQWVASNGLFLHVSQSCLRSDSVALDPLFFGFITTGPAEREDERARRVIDAFNALKQNYLSARYQSWTALSDESPAALHLAEIDRESPFLDTHENGRFGVRTGLLIQAFAAATNLLDQVAVFAHLYLESGRNPRSVTMRSLWRSRRGEFDPTLRAEIESGNRGLLALCDLAGDLAEGGSSLAEFTELRHTATHRLVVAHWLPPEKDSSGWLERVDAKELATNLVAQLHVGRSALVYLARLVDIHERRSGDGAERKRMKISVHPTQRESDLPL